MAFELDGLAALRGMADNPDAFQSVASDISKLSRAILTKALKDKSTSVEVGRTMATALPEGTFAHVTDGMKDNEVAAVALRFDPHDPGLKAAGRDLQAVRIEEILTGARQPAAKAPSSKAAAVPGKGKAAKAEHAPGVAKALKVLRSKSMRGAKQAAE